MTIKFQKDIETPLVGLSFFLPNKANLIWLNETQILNEKRRTSEFIITALASKEQNKLLYAIYDK